MDWYYVVLIVLGAIAAFFFVIYLIAPYAWKLMARDLNATYEPSDKIDHASPEESQDQDCIPKIEMLDDGSYSITFGKGRSLKGGSPLVHSDGKWHGGDFEGLKLLSTKKEEFSDDLGQGWKHIARWKLISNGTQISAGILEYQEAPFVKFEIIFHDGVSKTSTRNRNLPIVKFPNFDLEGPNRRVFAYRVQVFTPPIKHLVNTSTQGPVVFYDNELNSFVLGPADNFVMGRTGTIAKSFDFETNNKKKIQKNLVGDVTIFHGIEGLVESIPVGYTHSSLLLFTKGINKAIVDWCGLLQKIHKVPPRDPLDDLFTARLGYWTDNGAYYYYKTEKGMDYASTLLHAKQIFDEKGIPFRYFQLDSWWYPKVPKKSWTRPPKKWFAPLVKGLAKGGADKWEPIPEHFPEGLSMFRRKLGLPLAAHARWFAPETGYRPEYKFEINDFGAHPLEQRFWEDLMANAKSMGIEMYEQDWITTMFNNIPFLRRDIYAGENMLNWMGKAAENHELTIQYCMAPPGVFMQALKLPAVTNARTGGDYWARAPKEFFIPDITQANILCWGIGIWPSYDVYYSKKTSIFTNQFLYREHYPEFMTITSVLGGGLVCPGDRAPNADANLLLKSCNGDGILLKPDRPLTPNDLMFKQHEKPYIMDTWTRKGDDLEWNYIVAVSMWPKRVKESYVTLEELGIIPEGIIYDFHSESLWTIEENKKISLPKKYMGYRYLVRAPWLIKHEFAVVGSIGKFVTAANNLISDISVAPKIDITFVISDKAGQEHNVLCYSAEKPAGVQFDDKVVDDWTYNNSSMKLVITCRIPSKGEMMVKIEF